MKQSKLTLWAGRTTVARGYEFVAEREVTKDDAQLWLKVFRDDEPKVIFIVSKNKPKVGK
jgi:hypothetical protein